MLFTTEMVTELVFFCSNLFKNFCKKRFLTLIKWQENKSPDFIEVRKYITICEKHFTNDDIIVSIVSKKKKLKRGAEPPIFTIWPEHV